MYLIFFYIFTILKDRIGLQVNQRTEEYELQLLALRQRAEERQSQIEEKQLRKEQREEVEMFLISLNDVDEIVSSGNIW